MDRHTCMMRERSFFFAWWREKPFCVYVIAWFIHPVRDTWKGFFSCVMAWKPFREAWLRESTLCTWCMQILKQIKSEWVPTYGPCRPTDPVLVILRFIFISDSIPYNFENCIIWFSNSLDIPLDMSLDSVEMIQVKAWCGTSSRQIPKSSTSHKVVVPCWILLPMGETFTELMYYCTVTLLFCIFRCCWHSAQSAQFCSYNHDEACVSFVLIAIWSCVRIPQFSR